MWLYHVVGVGAVSVDGQFFAAVTSESAEFQQEPFDGLMGMGLPALSNLGQVRTWPCALSL